MILSRKLKSALGCAVALSGLPASFVPAAELAHRPDSPASLYAGFVNPADDCRPRTWWHWMDDEVTQYGITKDLEAMKEIGLKGAQIFFIGGNEAVEGEMSLLSPAWLDAVEHAAKECERLGLKLGSVDKVLPLGDLSRAVMRECGG